jgi:hypothetical protein
MVEKSVVDMPEHKTVYSVQSINSNGEVYMRRIGTASTNGDGSISIEMEEMPTCKDLLVMDYVERDYNAD